MAKGKLTGEAKFFSFQGNVDRSNVAHRPIRYLRDSRR